MLAALTKLVLQYRHHMQCYIFFSLSFSLPDCCFTHTVKLAHGRARGRNTVHITCSTVCGCPDSSSREPLRHHLLLLLHDGELHSSPAMQPASLPSLRRTFFSIFQVALGQRVAVKSSGLTLRQWNGSKISQIVIN